MGTESIYDVEDSKIIDMLKNVKTIALIGASSKANRDSFKVMAFLIDKGYQVFPVNPVLKDTTILNQKVYRSISDIPVRIDMIDVFRQSKYLYNIVLEAIEENIPSIWTQLGVTDAKAESLASENNITMVINRCPVIEGPRLKLFS